MSMEITEEALSRFLVENYKRMLSEEGDSNSRTDSSGSPPHKRPRRSLASISFEQVLKLDAEDIFVKDYLDWFISSKAEVNETEILLPENYSEWFSTLGSKAKADVLHPCYYVEWYVAKFNLEEPPKFTEAELIEDYGHRALEFYNKNNKCDYEYARDVALNYNSGSDTHLNFYGRLKVSPSRPESEAPERLFFAAVDFDDTVLDCRIVDSEEFGKNTRGCFRKREIIPAKILIPASTLLVLLPTSVLVVEVSPLLPLKNYSN